MSTTIMTVVFGPADRRRRTPRWVDAVADLVVGGSGVFIVHGLGGDEVRRVRLRPEGVSDADTLVAGFALVGSVDLQDAAAALADELRASSEDISLTQDQADVLIGAVAEIDVSVVVTSVGGALSVSAADFSNTRWAVWIASANDPEPVTR